MRYFNENEVIKSKKSNDEIKKFVRIRIEKLQNTMKKKAIDVVILNRPENIFYFTNFNPIITSHLQFMIITQDDYTLLVHSIRLNHALNESAIDKIQCYGKWGATNPISEDPIGGILEIIGSKEIVLGIEEDYISLKILNNAKSILNISLIKDISNDINYQRLIKDNYEIELCRMSGKIVDIGVEQTIKALMNDMSEAEACTEGQYAMRKYWHENLQQYEVSGFSSTETAQIDSFVVWCMSNGRLNYGCDCPSGYVPQSGDLTLPMSWGRIQGYNVENERSVIVGAVDEKKRRAYEAMLLARQEIFDRLKPGVIIEDLYLAAMKVFEKEGFGDILPGRCGHGMGLSTHEFPSITKGNTDSLLPGMIFTIEPGLMSSEFGATRHSDTVLIKKNGFEFLTKTIRGFIKIK